MLNPLVETSTALGCFRTSGVCLHARRTRSGCVSQTERRARSRCVSRAILAVSENVRLPDDPLLGELYSKRQCDPEFAVVLVVRSCGCADPVRSNKQAELKALSSGESDDGPGGDRHARLQVSRGLSILGRRHRYRANSTREDKRNRHAGVGNISTNKRSDRRCGVNRMIIAVPFVGDRQCPICYSPTARAVRVEYACINEVLCVELHALSAATAVGDLSLFSLQVVPVFAHYKMTLKSAIALRLRIDPENHFPRFPLLSVVGRVFLTVRPEQFRVPVGWRRPLCDGRRLVLGLCRCEFRNADLRNDGIAWAISFATGRKACLRRWFRFRFSGGLAGCWISRWIGSDRRRRCHRSK